MSRIEVPLREYKWAEQRRAAQSRQVMDVHREDKLNENIERIETTQIYSVCDRRGYVALIRGTTSIRAINL